MTPMIVEHPLLQHKLSILRNKQTGTKEFRDLVGEIATLLCYEATRDLPLEEVEIETPITMAKTKVLAGRKLALVPILRAGMGMLDGMLTLLPAAKVGFIGLYRNEETLQPVEYFCKPAGSANPQKKSYGLSPPSSAGTCGRWTACACPCPAASPSRRQNSLTSFPCSERQSRSCPRYPVK